MQPNLFLLRCVLQELYLIVHVSSHCLCVVTRPHGMQTMSGVDLMSS